MSSPQSPHPKGKDPVTLTVTQEELFVLMCGVEEIADKEDGEFAYLREVAENLSLPKSVVNYSNMKV